MVSDNLEDNDIELNPLYSKIEYELSRLEDDGDPLGLKQGHNIDWISLNQDIDRLLSQGLSLQVLVWKLRASLHIDGFSSLNKYLNLMYDLISDFKNKESLTDREAAILGSYSSALSWFSTTFFVAELKDSRMYPEENFLMRKMFELDLKNDNNNDISLNDIISLVNKADKYFAEKNLPNFQDQVKGSLSLIKNISEYVNEHSSGYILDCHFIEDSLTRLSFKINSVYELINMKEGGNQLEENLPNDGQGEEGVVLASGSNHLNSQSLRSRREVLLVLDNLLDYFGAYEPSHPAPILIRRIKKMIGMDFEAIIQELLPESEDLLKRYIGNKSVEHSDYNQ